MFRIIGLVLFLSSSCLYSQEILEYKKLKEAYSRYDTTFFNSLKGKIFEIKCKNKSIRSFVTGSGISPILDWHLNKKADFCEFNYLKKGNSFTLEIYDYDISDKLIIYTYRITGLKPRVEFYKGEKNWFKIKSLHDIELIETVISPLPKMG